MASMEMAFAGETRAHVAPAGCRPWMIATGTTASVGTGTFAITGSPSEKQVHRLPNYVARRPEESSA
jgi:hypothetical protein